MKEKEDIATQTSAVRFEDVVITKLVAGKSTAEAVRRAVDETPGLYRDYILRSCKKVN